MYLDKFHLIYVYAFSALIMSLEWLYMIPWKKISLVQMSRFFVLILVFYIDQETRYDLHKLWNTNYNVNKLKIWKRRICVKKTYNVIASECEIVISWNSCTYELNDTMRWTYVANEKLSRGKHPTKLRQPSHFPSNEHVALRLIFIRMKKFRMRLKTIYILIIRSKIKENTCYQAKYFA